MSSLQGRGRLALSNIVRVVIVTVSLLAILIGGTTSFTFYPMTTGRYLLIGAGQTYTYVTNFATGQSVSGLVTAQN